MKSRTTISDKNYGKNSYFKVMGLQSCIGGEGEF